MKKLCGKGAIRVLLYLALAPALPAGATSPSKIDPGFVSETDEHLKRMESMGFAGVVLVARDGRPVLAKGYGLADRERSVEWTPSTVSTIGSITKQFTGAAILLLQEEGLLNVKDPITKYFDGVPEEKRGITLHHLLTHSSGIVDLKGYGDWDPIEREAFISKSLKQPLAFSPGASYRYSNAGFSFLGAIIEKLSGGSYEEFLRKRLFVPHGLYETGYVLPDWGQGRQAQGYRGDTRWGTVLERPMAPDGPYWVLRANGGIHTTAYDMLRWASALMEGRVLSEESMKQYWAPHVDEGGGDSFYGYGWSMMDQGGVRVITHNGGNGIFMADMAIIPSSKTVLFMQTNVRADSDDAPRILQRMGARLIGGRPYPEVPRAIRVEPEKVKTLAGSYSVASGGSIVVRADGEKLLVQAGEGCFSQFHSTEAATDPGRIERLSAGIEAIVGAYVEGDFNPLREAYRRSVTVDFLKQSYHRRRSRMESTLGPFQGFQVRGTALRGSRDYTVVRFKYERGNDDRAYVWEGDILRGVSSRGLPDIVPFVPVAANAFASWDPISGTSKKLVFFKGRDGLLTLKVGEGENALEAVR